MNEINLGQVIFLHSENDLYAELAAPGVIEDGAKPIAGEIGVVDCGFKFVDSETVKRPTVLMHPDDADPDTVSFLAANGCNVEIVREVARTPEPLNYKHAFPMTGKTTAQWKRERRGRRS